MARRLVRLLAVVLVTGLAVVTAGCHYHDHDHHSHGHGHYWGHHYHD